LRVNASRLAADEMMKGLLRLFEVATVNRAVLEGILSLGFDDFEDAVLHEAGRLAGTRAIVTRDLSGFRAATFRTCDSETLVSALDAADEF